MFSAYERARVCVCALCSGVACLCQALLCVRVRVLRSVARRFVMRSEFTSPCVRSSPLAVHFASKASKVAPAIKITTRFDVPSDRGAARTRAPSPARARALVRADAFFFVSLRLRDARLDESTCGKRTRRR